MQNYYFFRLIRLNMSRFLRITGGVAILLHSHLLKIIDNTM